MGSQSTLQTHSSKSSTTSLNPHSFTMADADAILKVCDIYDWDGKGELDLFYLGDIAYALGFNVTKKVCVAQGQTDEEGKKFAKFDEIVAEVQKLFAEIADPEDEDGFFPYTTFVDRLCGKA